MNPWVLLGVLIAAMALLGSGYGLGKNHATNACIAEQAKGIQAAQGAANKESDRKETVGAAREVSREQIRVVYRTIKEKVDENVKSNPVVYDCSLDADGLRLWNAANSGRAAPLSGEPDYTLPSAATGKIRKLGGSVTEPHRGDGAGSAVPGPAQ